MQLIIVTATCISASLNPMMLKTQVDIELGIWFAAGMTVGAG